MLSGKILLITDDGEAGQIWGYMLEQKGLETRLVSPTENTTEMRSEQTFDLIILDVYTAEMNTQLLIRHLRNEGTVPILLMAECSNEAVALAAYDAGADEFICKPISPRLLLAKIKAWMQRSWTVPTKLLDSFQAGGFLLEPALRQLARSDGTAVKLTNLEFRLLHLLMSHPSQILDSHVIIDRVWGNSGGADSVLVKNVIYRLRKKIEPNPSQPRYIHSIAGEGYMFQP